MFIWTSNALKSADDTMKPCVVGLFDRGVSTTAVEDGIELLYKGMS